MHHRPAGSEAHLQPEGFGPCAVTVQCRTTLFGANRARLRNTTPSPPAFFQMLAAAFAEALATDAWSLPSMAEVLRSAAALGVPEPVHPPASSAVAAAASAAAVVPAAAVPAEAVMAAAVPAEAVVPEAIVPAAAAVASSSAAAAAASKAVVAPAGGRAAAKGKAKAKAKAKPALRLRTVAKAEPSSVAAGPPAKRARGLQGVQR